MEIASQICLKVLKICIKTPVTGIISLKTNSIYIFFYHSGDRCQKAIFGNFPVNFRFSGNWSWNLRASERLKKHSLKNISLVVKVSSFYYQKTCCQVFCFVVKFGSVSSFVHVSSLWFFFTQYKLRNFVANWFFLVLPQLNFFLVMSHFEFFEFNHI